MLVVSLLVIAVPIFVFGFVLQLIFGVKLGWVAADGRWRLPRSTT